MHALSHLNVLQGLHTSCRERTNYTPIFILHGQIPRILAQCLSMLFIFLTTTINFQFFCFRFSFSFYFRFRFPFPVSTCPVRHITVRWPVRVSHFLHNYYRYFHHSISIITFHALWRLHFAHAIDTDSLKQ